MGVRLVVLIAALALAVGPGCIGKTNDPVAPTTTGNESNATNVTLAPNGAGSISAFNETNKTETTGIGAMMHTHDYWGGASRKVIFQMDSALIPLPVIPCKRPGCNADNPMGDEDNYPAGTAIADYDIPAPPAAGLVFEGTDHLEVVFHNVTAGPPGQPHPYIHIGLDYLTSADEPYHFRKGPEIAPDKPAIIPVKPLETDMPHQTKSLWVFRIYTQEANQFAFNFTVTAVKGSAVANWPPHPDLYKDKPERVVFDSDVKYDSKGASQYWVDGSDNGWTYPKRVISWGTDSLDVIVTGVTVTMAAPVPPTKVFLEYHNASYISKVGNGDLAGARLSDPTSDGKNFKFQIKTDPQGYDTPYGQSSRWSFRMVPMWGCPDGQERSECAPVPFSVAYHLTIVAHGHSIDGKADPATA